MIGQNGVHAVHHVEEAVGLDSEFVSMQNISILAATAMQLMLKIVSEA